MEMQLKQNIISKVKLLSGIQFVKFVEYVEKIHNETKQRKFTDWYPDLSFISKEGLIELNEYLDSFMSDSQVPTTSISSFTIDVNIELTRAYFAYVSSAKIFKQIFYERTVIHPTMPLDIIDERICNTSNGGSVLELSPIIIFLNDYSYDNNVLTILDAEISMSSLYNLLILHNNSQDKDIQLPIYFAKNKNACQSDGAKKYNKYIYYSFVDYLKEKGVNEFNVSSTIMHKIIDKIVDNPLINHTFDTKANAILKVLTESNVTSGDIIVQIKGELDKIELV